MRPQARKKHYHPCCACKGKAVCWDVHNKDKTDIIAAHCDECLRKIVQEMGELNV